jgi:hypothetical protein
MYVFPIILAFAILLGVTSAIVRSLLKKFRPKWMVAATIIIAIGLGIFMYNGIYRPYGLYQNHYQQATGQSFPTGGDYLFADTWIDDAESDGYSSIALISLNDVDRIKLIDRLTEQLDERINYVLALSPAKIIASQYGIVEQRSEKRNGTMFKIDKIRYYFGFLDDNQTVVVYIISK